MLSRRSVLAGAAFLPLAAQAQQDITFFRILTGGTVGTYFPIGGLIANAISNPPGSRPCNEGGSCGVPGLVATSVASNGSVANVAAIAAGTAQSGFVQSDIAHWAYNGTGIYQGHPKVEALRAIANLYPESIQLVVRKGSGIKSVADLRGRKVSLDEPGSGTLVDARLILSAFGLSEKDLKAEYFRAQQVADSLKDGTIDAFFSAEEIPDNAYRGVAGVKTVSVHAIWATSSKQSEELIYKVTAALWNPATRKLLDSGHAKGRKIRLETATTGIGIPLHLGAEKFYKEQGLIR